jgi:plastocyanin
MLGVGVMSLAAYALLPPATPVRAGVVVEGQIRPAQPASGSLGAPSWTDVPVVDLTTGGGMLSALTAFSSTDVWAVGNYLKSAQYVPLAEQDIDGTWTVETVPASKGTTSELYAVGGTSTSDLWAVGTVQPIGSNEAETLAYNWNGSAWSAVPTPSPSPVSNYLYGLSVDTSSDVWAVGVANDPTTDEPAALIERWNGSTWNVVAAAPNTGVVSTLTSVAVASPTDVWAVGWTQGAPDYQRHALIEHWDGKAWSDVAAPAPPSGSTSQQLNAMVVVRRDLVYAIGYQESSSQEPYVLEWNGSDWSRVTVPDPSGDDELFGGAAVASGDIWMVGWNYTAVIEDGYRVEVPQPLLLHYNGTTWQDVPDALPHNGYLTSIAASGGVLTTVGEQAITVAGAVGGKTFGQQVQPVQVLDTGFSPSAAQVPLGATAVWSIPLTDESDHTVTDASGLGLFDSGAKQPGTSYLTVFPGAGTYTVTDSQTGNTCTITVPATVTPTSGTTSTSFQVDWAAGPPPSGLVFNVQVETPGSSTWTPWQTGVTTSSAAYVPSAGAGTYQFEAQVQSDSSSAVSGWSPPVSISVST